MKLTCGACEDGDKSRTVADLDDEGQPQVVIRFDLDNPDWSGQVARPSRPQAWVRRDDDSAWRLSCKCRATFVATEEELRRAATSARERGMTRLTLGSVVGRRVS